MKTVSSFPERFLAWPRHSFLTWAVCFVASLVLCGSVVFAMEYSGKIAIALGLLGVTLLLAVCVSGNASDNARIAKIRSQKQG